MGRRQQGQVEEWPSEMGFWDRGMGGASWSRVEGQCSGVTGSVLLYWSVGTWWAQDFHSARPALLKARLRETRRGWEKLSPMVDKGEPFRGASVSHFAARTGWVALGMSPRLSGP